MRDLRTQRWSTIQGYFNMGPMRIPALPPIVALTDRADGSIWYLTHDVTFTHVAINNDLTAVNISPAFKYKDLLTYGPYDGPWIDNRTQIMVRSGCLGYDYHSTVEQGIMSYGSAPLLTRRKVSRNHFLIYDGTHYYEGRGPLSFTEAVQ